MARTARTYAPLLAVAVAFALMVAIVNPVTRTTQQALAAGQQVTATPGQVATGGVAATDGETVTSSDGAGGAAGTTGGGGGGQGAGAGVQPCADRAQQVPGDPYSPPCFTFNGDNGGNTYQGVTATDITVAVRELEGPTAGEIFAQLSGTPVISSKEAVENTILALADYFNSHFQLYGRKIKIQFFKGQGSGASELLGGGKEQALADAVHVSQEMGAFADLSGITLPYADALVQQGILNFGAPYPSQEWFVSRQPFAWSNFPDGTNVVKAASAEILARQPAGSLAEFAGGPLQGKPRVYGIVAPENQEYQESVAKYAGILASGGIVPKINLKYKLDISSMPNQASNVIAQLKDAGVTTVLCGCDPVMLALGLTPKANEQDYYPEWATAGLAFVDQDIVSQLIDNKQWARAFGIAYNAESEPQGRSYPYAAYKQERPSDEPAFGVEELYYGMYMMAIGLQMAGPSLTPQTFETGMFSYPAQSGPRGLWHFGEGDYTTTDDFREIWWDPNQISGQNNKPGAWVQLNGGQRYASGSPPTGDAPFFKR
ncbi:MAG: hypothetical protein QOE63_1771 [Acidimicrobiaceae bacterium]